MISALEYRRPDTLEEAVEVLAKRGGDARVIAGGTALVILMKQRLVRPDILVSLDRIEELSAISTTAEGIRIGATATHRQVETSPLVREAAPLLTRTLAHVATIRIRNVGTLGGNIAHADPNQDPPVTLIAHGATVTLTGPEGSRIVPVEKFFVDYYETALQEGEVLTTIDVPRLPDGAGASYLKFLPRSADDYATVSVAAVVRLNGGDRCAEARVALGSVGAVPVRSLAVEEALRDTVMDDETIAAAASAVQEEIDPITDGRGSAEYKREMAQVFIERAVSEALADARSGG